MFLRISFGRQTGWSKLQKLLLRILLRSFPPRVNDNDNHVLDCLSRTSANAIPIRDSNFVGITLSSGILCGILRVSWIDSSLD